MRGYLALTGRELRKWVQQPVLLLLGVVQPVIWMSLFGKSLNLAAVAGPAGQAAFQSTFGTSDYFSFMAAGMPSFVVLFTAVFSGMSIVWDRRLGFLGKVLSTPVSRAAVVASKMSAAVVRSLAQAALILALAILFGLHLRQWSVARFALVLLGLFLMATGLSALFTSIAIRSTRWETQMAVVNLLNLPLLFASSTLTPPSLMPPWLQPVARVNPVSHATDLARQLLVLDTDWGAVAGDVAFLAVFAALFASVGLFASWRYPSK